MTTVAAVLEALGAVPDPVGGADRHAAVTGASSLQGAGPGALTFCTGAAAERHADDVRRSAAAVIIADGAVADRLAGGEPARAVVIRSANARLDFIRMVSAFFAPGRPAPGVHPSAVVEPGARVGADVSIGAGCTVAGEGVVIGDRAVLHPGVHVLRDVRIAEDVTIHSGTVIGADGYGYERDERGELVRFPHIGGVVIEAGVEIGANTCVDRGALDDTWIGPRVRIDNLVHIAHNVRVGADAAVIAHAMVAGSVRVGERAWIAPCACIREGVTIGEDALVGLGAVVTADVPPATTVLGNPGRDLDTHRALQAQLKRLLARD